MEPSAASENVVTNPEGLCRVLCLDGGGAKGFYTLGVLKEIEAMLGGPIHRHFNLIYGTSTGAIIAALLALGKSVDDIHELYKTHAPTVMRAKSKDEKSAALRKLAESIFGTATFRDVLTGIGIVTTRWATERPMIFKGHVGQAHGRTATFIPGFGVSISDAVQASCSAYPFFSRANIVTSKGDHVELIDGGYCANNPTLYAIADATGPMARRFEDLRVVSVGVGVYPEPRPRTLLMWAARRMLSVQLLQKTLEINTQSMDQLRSVLFKNVPTIRINQTFERPELATDLMEHDLRKLNTLRQLGADSFAKNEDELRVFLIDN